MQSKILRAIIPDKIAVEFEDARITYQELNYAANRLATVLKESGVSVGDMVAICTERSIIINMITAILAVLKSGAAYLPIETNIPVERKNYYLTTANAKAILSTLSDRTLFDVPNINIEAISNDVLPSPDPQVSSDGLAYVIFTSGSTGNPKGVMVRHY